MRERGGLRIVRCVGIAYTRDETSNCWMSAFLCHSEKRRNLAPEESKNGEGFFVVRPLDFALGKRGGLLRMSPLRTAFDLEEGFLSASSVDEQPSCRRIAGGDSRLTEVSCPYEGVTA